MARIPHANFARKSIGKSASKSVARKSIAKSAGRLLKSGKRLIYPDDIPKALRERLRTRKPDERQTIDGDAKMRIWRFHGDEYCLIECPTCVSWKKVE